MKGSGGIYALGLSPRKTIRGGDHAWTVSQSLYNDNYDDLSS